MITPNTAYVIPFSTTLAGVPTAADSTPTAVLWRNGSAEVTSVVIVTTANTGIYHASFTTDAGWAATDRIWLVVSATIATVAYKGIAWDSFAESDSKSDIATAVVEKAVSSGNPVGSVGYILHAISTMIEYVGGLWRFKSTAVSEVAIPAQNGDWAITRTFQVSGGDKVSGVRMSLAGVAGKTDTTGTDGIATIKADDGTFTLRVVVPAGYEDVADTTVVVSGADSTATVTLVATTVTQAEPPLCAVVLPVVDQYGAALAGVGVMIRFVSFAALASPDAVVMSPPPVLTSNGSGLVTANLMRLANYEAFYAIDGAVKRVDFSVPDAGAYIVVEAN